MNGVVRLDLTTYELKKLCHRRLDTRKVSGLIGGPHQDAIKPLVVRTDQQPLARGPLGSCGIPTLETVLATAHRHVYD